MNGSQRSLAISEKCEIYSMPTIASLGPVEKSLDAVASGLGRDIVEV